MNTFQLTCFLTVAETLSFAKAAKHLNVTQPAVTHQIHSLEEELNTQLFKRTTRSVEITQKGLIFLNLSPASPQRRWLSILTKTAGFTAPLPAPTLFIPRDIWVPNCNIPK